MNARIIAFVGCRLLALYLLLNYALVALVKLIQTIAPVAGGGSSLDFAINALIFVIFLGAGLGIWLRAGWISDRLVGSRPEIGKPYPGVEGWQALGVALVGGLFLMAGVKYIGAWLAMITKDSLTAAQVQPQIIMVCSGFNLAIGILLLTYARNIVEGLKALRSWGNKPFVSEDEE